MTEHERYMGRCLQLALNGAGRVTPNPMVGCVIVHQDRIIGEGWHRKPGEAHAEVLAIRSVKDSQLLTDCTLYVNLEPCSHYGRTPPCSDLIIEKNIPRVVVGSRDPHSAVNGKGIEKLQRAGIEVTEGILQGECQWLNRRFFTYHQQQRPYIILKWAQSADGFMDIDRGPSQQGIHWITGDEARQWVHRWRATEDAILVGYRTAMNDRPSLTVREVSGKNPLRIVIDPSLSLAEDHPLFTGRVPTLVFNTQRDEVCGPVEYLTYDPDEDSIPQLLKSLYERHIQSLIVEGGAFTLHRFLASGTWDEARIFTGPEPLHRGLKAPVYPGNVAETYTVGQDRLQIFYRS